MNESSRPARTLEAGKAGIPVSRVSNVWMIALAMLCTAAHANAQAGNADQVRVNPLLTRPGLLDGPGSPKEALRQHGVDLQLWWTQFYQGLVSGDGSKQWQYGGKGDIIVTVDLQKASGLWAGLSLNIHQELEYGQDVNSQGDGTYIPVNTALAFPRLGGRDQDTSIVVTQRFNDRVSLSFGKFNMLDAASRTPLLGGGGLDTFQNTALAAPISGVTPPYILGASLSVRTKPATLTLLVYDPRNAQDSEVIRYPFADGVTFSLAANFPLSIGGLPGFHTVRGVYSTKEGVDLNDIPQLALPPELRPGLGTKRGYWYASYSVQQFLWQSPTDPTKGWGLFGQVAISDGNPNPFRGHYFFGIGGNSFLPRRIDDRWGIAYFSYRLSDALHATASDLGFGLRDESGVEAYYNLAATPWSRVTVDIQLINPFPAAKDTAAFAGLRWQSRL